MQSKNIFSRAGVDDSDDDVAKPVVVKKKVAKDDNAVAPTTDKKVHVPKVT